MALSIPQIRAAIAYNTRRSFDVALTRRIQRTVGTQVDGVIGSATVRAVAAWQETRGLVGDGKIGPLTLVALQAAWEAAGEDPMGLSPAEVASALAYDRARNYAPALITRIQETVSVTPTGEFDEPTVIAVARWQAEHDLYADGKVGPNTLRALQASWDALPPARTTYRVHPGIGIARLGDSPTEFFIGPEAPGLVAPEQPVHRDETGFIKRQAARFRVYEYRYSGAGNLMQVREVTSDQAQVHWTVQLANRKAASATFPPTAASARRNAAIEEESLVIDSGAQSVTGTQAHLPMQGFFLGGAVRLGDLRTDDRGRLLVLGGHGVSRAPGGQRITSFANNDGWHDDVSDGPVRASVVLSTGETVEAEPAWVVVAPPRYAPEIHNVVTWWDQAFALAAQQETTLTVNQLSFTRHIYPILERTAKLSWVSAVARTGHGPGRTWDFLQPARLAQLASASPEHRALRERVARSLRRVDAGTGNMPLLNTGLDPADPERSRAATLTDLQISWMEQWALGVFTEDWTGASPVAQPLDALQVSEQPAALDRAALEACIGGPFYPGIEVGFAMARPDTYGAPFRIATSHPAGYLTASLAVPWQADFQACGERWWPAQRPVSVYRGDSTTPDSWIGEVDMPGMVTAWATLGFIRREGERYVERERRELDPIV